MSPATPVTLGLEACLAETPEILKGRRFGLLLNQASVDRRFRYAHHLLAERLPGQLRTLFTPQHGLWSEQQDNMIETPHGIDASTGLRIHSLYAETRKPTAEMLDGIEVLVVDLQDVGTRVYTYVWTVSLCLEACADAGVPVLVLDRPNPLGGEEVEGALLDPAFASFVGRAGIPMRHGLTIAELARVLNEMLQIGAEVHVVPMRGWRRSMLWPDTGRTWVPPSPNLPRYEGALVYPGQVLLEGTLLSEGRGTTTPFEVCGAPWLDPARLLADPDLGALPGLILRPVRYSPTFHKFAGQSCGGVCLHVTDPPSHRPYAATLALLAAIRRRWPDRPLWRDPPYEYEHRLMPIDILAGSERVRRSLDAIADPAGSRPGELTRAAGLDPEAWWSRVGGHLLYPVDPAEACPCPE